VGRKLRETRQPVSERPGWQSFGAHAEVMTDRISHDELWVMGVLEPILLLLLIAVIGAFLGLL